MTQSLQRHCRATTRLVVALIAAIAVLVPLSTASAQSNPTFAQVLEGAKKEGR